MFTIITPYVFETEIKTLKESIPWEIPVLMECDVDRIGPDLMFQRLWKKCKTDIFILHADMTLIPDSNWYIKLNQYVEKYPEAGMFGCKLLYPAKNEEGYYYIQSAGGKIENDRPDHFGSGLNMDNKTFFKTPELDKGQYDFVRKVAWETFGGLYVRREVLNQVGDFDSRYEWSYGRDVDYCFETRKAGWEIYHVPIPIMHHESKDTKRIRKQEHYEAEFRNQELLRKKWQNTEYWKTIDERV